jgi:hypothetical protein
VAPDTTEVLRSLAAHLADSGLARWNSDSTPYGAGTLPAIFFEHLPDKPDNALAIAAYNDDRTRDRDNPDIYIQIRGRAAGTNPLAVHDLMDRVYAALDDSSHALWGTTRVLICLRHIRGPLITDANNRWTRPDSYTITINPSGETHGTHFDTGA